MSNQSILDEIAHLHGVSSRLEGIADDYPTATTELLIISGNVLGMATMLGMLITAKLEGNKGNPASN